MFAGEGDVVGVDEERGGCGEEDVAEGELVSGFERKGEEVTCTRRGE